MRFLIKLLFIVCIALLVLYGYYLLTEPARVYVAIYDSEASEPFREQARLTVQQELYLEKTPCSKGTPASVCPVQQGYFDTKNYAEAVYYKKRLLKIAQIQSTKLTVDVPVPSPKEALTFLLEPYITQ